MMDLELLRKTKVVFEQEEYEEEDVQLKKTFTGRRNKRQSNVSF